MESNFSKKIVDTKIVLEILGVNRRIQEAINNAGGSSGGSKVGLTQTEADALYWTKTGNQTSLTGTKSGSYIINTTGTLASGVATHSGNASNAAWTGLNINNTYNATTGQVGSTANLAFNMQYLLGVNQVVVNAATISAYKIGDYTGATASFKGGLNISVANGSVTPTRVLDIDNTGMHTIYGNASNAAWTGLNIVNTYRPATGQIASTADLVFKLTGFDNDSYYAFPSAKISSYKTDDWVTEAGGLGAFDSGLRFFTVINGAYNATPVITIDSGNLTTFGGSLTHVSGSNLPISCGVIVTSGSTTVNLGVGIFGMSCNNPISSGTGFQISSSAGSTGAFLINTGAGRFVTSSLLIQNSATSGYLAYASSTNNLGFNANATLNSSGHLSVVKIATTTSSGYGEMYMYGNTTATGIHSTNVYTGVFSTFGNNDATLAPTNDSTFFTYKAGIEYAIASVATYAGGVQIQCTTTGNHALLAGEPVTLTGMSVAGYNGTYVVQAAGLAATTFVVIKAYSATATGFVTRPATLKCLVTNKYQASFSVSGTPESPNDNLKFELNKDITPLDNIGVRSIWSSTTKYESVSASGNISLTANQYVWLSAKNYSGNGDIILYSANVSLQVLK